MIMISTAAGRTRWCRTAYSCDGRRARMGKVMPSVMKRQDVIYEVGIHDNMKRKEISGNSPA